MPARLNGQRYFLTYSQVADWDFSEDDLATFLSSLPHFSWCEVAQEQHQDGGYHFHAVVVFTKRLRGGMATFDHRQQHPNIQAVRNATTDLYRVRHYIRKGDAATHSVETHKEEPCTYAYQPTARGAVPDYLAPSERHDWGDILNEATNVETFLQLVRDNKPGDYILRYDAVKAFAQHHYNNPSAYVSPYEDESWNTTADMDNWVQTVLRQVCNQCTWGRSGQSPPLARGPPLFGGT